MEATAPSGAASQAQLRLRYPALPFRAADARGHVRLSLECPVSWDQTAAPQFDASGPRWRHVLTRCDPLQGIMVPAIPAAHAGQQGDRRCPSPSMMLLWGENPATPRADRHGTHASLGSSGAVGQPAGGTGARRQTQKAFPGGTGVSPAFPAISRSTGPERSKPPGRRRRAACRQEGRWRYPTQSVSGLGERSRSDRVPGRALVGPGLILDGLSQDLHPGRLWAIMFHNKPRGAPERFWDMVSCNQFRLAERPGMRILRNTVERRSPSRPCVA